MGFYGLNLISFLVICVIALLLFGSKYLREIFEDLRLILRNFIKILLIQDKKQSNDNKSESESEADITSR